MSTSRPIVAGICAAALAAAIAVALVVERGAEESGTAPLARRARAFAVALEGGARAGMDFVAPQLASRSQGMRTAEALGVLSGRQLLPARVAVEPGGKGYVRFEVVQPTLRGPQLLGSIETSWLREPGAGAWWLVEVE